MDERIVVKVNGESHSVPAGTIVAGAIAKTGEMTFRRSITGQPRGPVCGMGVCMECRVTIDGQQHQRSCQTICESGMEVETENVKPPSLSAGQSAPPLDCDIAIVGAGPAGIAAACAATESGKKVVLIDDSPWLGGQIWRGEQSRPSVSQAREWLDRLAASGATLFDRSSVVAAPTHHVLRIEQDGGIARDVRWKRLILATGARELFLPFPGWTLPGITGAGGLYSMVKNGWPIAGKRVVIAGSGPLLLATADGLKKHGAHVRLVAEQASRWDVIGFGIGMFAHPDKLKQALLLRYHLHDVPYWCGVWPARANGDQHVESVTLTNGAQSWTEPCDYLACGFGLVPNVELPLALGCRLKTDGFVQVDEWQRTTRADVYCAGEPTGIGGADCALVEGQIAGYAATDALPTARQLFGQRQRWHRFRERLAEAFSLREELKSLADEETLLCRCEDVPMQRVCRFNSWRDTKLQTRCGMGSCQGRICGAAAKVVFGWGMESVRPPILPARVGSLRIPQSFEKKETCTSNGKA